MGRAHVDEEALFEITLARLRAGFEMRQLDARNNAQAMFNDLLRRSDFLLSEAEAIENDEALTLAMGLLRRRPGSAKQARDRAGEVNHRALSILELMTEFSKAALGRFERHGFAGMTPEAKVRGPSRETSIYRLFMREELSAEHLAAAEEIAEIFEAVVRPVSAKSRAMDGAMSGSKNASFGIDYSRTSDWIARAHRRWFRPWCERLRAQESLDFVMAVVVDGDSIDAARRRFRCGYNTALKRLIAGLDLWGEISGLEKRLLARVGASERTARRGRRPASLRGHTTNS